MEINSYWAVGEKKKVALFCAIIQSTVYYQILLTWGLWWNSVWFHLFHSSNEKELRGNLDVAMISKGLESMSKETEL